MKIGVAIDSWKLDIFKKHLKDFKYEVHPGVTDDTLSIIVFSDKDTLLPVVIAANKECADYKANRN